MQCIKSNLKEVHRETGKLLKEGTVYEKEQEELFDNIIA